MTDLQAYDMIVKKCKVHGDLTLAQTSVQARGNSVTHRCRLCKNERNKRYRERHPERIKEKERKYRQSNQERIKILQKAKHQRHYVKHREKVLENCKQYREANREKIRAIKRAYHKKYKHTPQYHENKRRMIKSQVERLSNSYVKSVIVRTGRLSKKDLPLELVDLKRILMRIGRILKHQKDKLMKITPQIRIDKKRGKVHVSKKY